jgi:FtsH-binding integral membrane protein
MGFFKAICAGARQPTVFVVAAAVTYILSSELHVAAVDPGVVTLISIGGTLGGLGLGRTFKDDARSPASRRRAVIMGMIFLAVAALAYVYVGDRMTNGGLQYVILCLLLLVAFASFGFLAHAAGLEIGEPPEAPKTAT